MRHWVLVGLATFVAAIWSRPHVSGIVVGGAAIGISTFLYAAGFVMLVRHQRRRLALAFVFVKLLAFLGLGWLVFAASEAYRPDPVGFVMGVSCMPVAAVWEAVRARKN